MEVKLTRVDANHLPLVMVSNGNPVALSSKRSLAWPFQKIYLILASHSIQHRDLSQLELHKVGLKVTITLKLQRKTWKEEV